MVSETSQVATAPSLFATRYSLFACLTARHRTFSMEEMMKSLLRLGAVALALASTGHAGGHAQAQALNDQIVGTGTLAEVYDEYPGGKTNSPWGPSVKWQLTYSLNGRFSLMLMAADRPKGTDP